VNTIFVYGLLKPGLSLHHVVAPFVERSATATVRGRLYDAGVPAARFDEDGEIEGFVFWLDEARLDLALRVLDDIEDEGDMYSRITIDARTDDGIVAAQAYHYLHALDASPFVGRTWGED
jgi:gamma-glutamylcyclotransferase (GGCT)/AIG2-like uncharacterized protein YtfP